MSLEHRFPFPLPNGLHARPASHLQEVTNRFAADIALVNHRVNRQANAKSVLSLVGADVKAGDLCSLLFSGDDAEMAFKSVTSYLEQEFLACDEALPQPKIADGECFLPRSLRAAGAFNHLVGVALCPGIGRGRVVLPERLSLPAPLRVQVASDPVREQELFDQGIGSVCEELGKKIGQSSRNQEAEVLKMHRSILQDNEFADSVRERILLRGLTAGQAIIAAVEHFCGALSAAENLYLRERVLDMEDVGARLLAAIYGDAAGVKMAPLTEDSVCVAENLTPSQFLALDRSWLKALILSNAGTTSHTVILARSFNIPTIVGVGCDSALLLRGQEVIVDADHGIVIPEVTEKLVRYYEREHSKAARLRERLSAFQGRMAVTSDGHRLEIAANIATAEEAPAVFEAGAEGIGLFRTEMLFMDRDAPPSEKEQSAIYAIAAKAGAGRPVIIRTFDIGGDKMVSYLGLRVETNPFLGYRGGRIYAEFSGILKIQLRAILSAAEHGGVKVMVPMVSSVEEVRMFKRLLLETREELRAAGSSAADAPIQLGIMLEVPSVAFQMPQLCQEVDFFSIGSNDLTQYFLAVDRENVKVAPLYGATHPGFLRLLQGLVGEARAAGKWIGLCGQAAEDATLLPLMIGLGLDEISVSGPRIGALKAAVCGASFSRCQALLQTVLDSATREEVEAHLKAFHSRGEQAPVLTPDLVVIESDAESKEEAIKQLCDTLYLGGRTEDPERVEEEIWVREETYSTGFGGGFAIPHCKSAHLNANSIVVLKTRQGSYGIDWGSLDGKPVHVAVLLAIRADNEGNEHLKILAKLSRQVMRDEFRERLIAENDPGALVSFIMSGLSDGADRIGAPTVDESQSGLNKKGHRT